MFAPAGYLMVEPLLGNLTEEVIDYFFARGSLKFREEWNNEGLELSLENEIIAIEWMNDYDFRTEAVSNWVIHLTLLYTEVYICSTSGVILKVGPYIFERLREDWAATDGELLNFDPINSSFDLQRRVFYTRTDIFKFFDRDSGLIKTEFNDEPNDEEEFKIHYGIASSRLMKNFSGWAVCFNASDVPKTAREFLKLVGYGEDTQALKTISHKRGRGRPSQQKNAARHYFLAFPDGHEKESKTWKEALRVVNRSLDRTISEDTLKRAVESYRQNRQ